MVKLISEYLDLIITRTYSDEGFRIMNIKTGQIYDEARSR